MIYKKIKCVIPIVFSLIVFPHIVLAWTRAALPDSIVKKNKYGFIEYQIPTNAFKLENALPKGYSIKGDVDYTNVIQKAINENKVLVFPNFPILINQKGILLQSNSSIYFQKKSKILFSGPANGKFSDIINIISKKNIKVYNANIEGSRFAQISQSGEWSAGITIRDSEDITILNPTIKNTYGDGIFVGSELWNGGVSKRIKIVGGWIDHPRRNGISITSVVDLRVEKVIVSNVQGAAPECAFDIEPSLPTERLSKILITDCTSFNCANSGFALNLTAFAETDVVKTTNIVLNNFSDVQSKIFIGFSINPNDKRTDPTGEIIIRNSRGYYNTMDYWTDPHKHKLKILFQNVQTKKKGENKCSKLAY